MTPDVLGVIAGRGTYPMQLADSAHKQGVGKVVAFAFKGETNPLIHYHADEVVWLHLGQLSKTIESFRERNIQYGVMAGQIKPTRLFNLRLDSRALCLLKNIKERNAHTLFGAVVSEFKQHGVELLPAYCFMESDMPPVGQLSSRVPDEREWEDIRLGIHVAKVTSGLDIGQTVVIKEGTILAVEGFEGTDATIRRAGKLGGPGAVVIKVAKQGHDMRFDIPVIGTRTFKMLKRAKISCLAVEAKRTILLEQEKIKQMADQMGISFLAVDMSGHEQDERD